MSNKGYRGGLPKVDWTFRSLYRSMLIILVPYTALSIGLLPPLLIFLFVIRELDFYNPLHIALLAFVIGADCSIMPGAIIEDDITLGIRSLVIKDQVLKAGKTYAGAPAKEISRKDVVVQPQV